MTEEYIEPTNAQLASFMAIIAKSDPRFAELQVEAHILEHIFDNNPIHRRMALRKHREFQKQANALGEKIEKGELMCQYIRPNGKRCVNHNEPGSCYCGLHQEEED